jgi:methylamine dehydrogenase accessory protein MauD
VSGGWLVSYILLWILVAVLAVAVVALLRQIGVLHARMSPMGTHFAGEGPDIGTTAPIDVLNLDVSRVSVSLVAFTSPTCTVCASLRPSLDALDRQYRDFQVRIVDLSPTTQRIFDAFQVRSTPYVVAIDSAAVVRGRGVANTLEQIEELLREARMELSA